MPLSAYRLIFFELSSSPNLLVLVRVRFALRSVVDRHGVRIMNVLRRTTFSIAYYGVLSLEGLLTGPTLGEDPRGPLWQLRMATSYGKLHIHPMGTHWVLWEGCG